MTTHGEMCLTDHILILNWNEKGYEIIRNLHSSDVVDPRQIVIVADQHVRLDPRVSENRGVVIVPGDPADVDVLLMANAPGASRAIILAEDADGIDGDTRSLLTALALANVAEDLHIVTEVKCAANLSHFEGLRHAIHEVVCPEEFVSRMLAQSAIFAGSGVVCLYDNLLSQSGDTCEIYLVPIPDRLLGCTFREAQEDLIDAEHEVVIPIGFVSGDHDDPGAYVINPDSSGPEGAHRLEVDDRLAIIAYHQPTLLAEEAG